MRQSDVWWLSATPFMAFNFAGLGTLWTESIAVVFVVFSLMLMWQERKSKGCACE
jgi:hypothetical protein